MEAQYLEKEKVSNQRGQSRSQTTFCINLNALRALSCIAVICTHIIEYDELRSQFRSLAYGGHMAVYFLFALSGYLLSYKLMKEIRRHLNIDQSEEPVEDESILIEVDEGDEVKAEKLSRLRLEENQNQLKPSFVFLVLRKYLWNRTLRLFPLYYGCWYLLKFFAREETTVQSLQMENEWKDILLLKTFPGHLWMMRIAIMFSYSVIPVFIICLCVAFYLQKKGFQRASSVCFFSIICSLLFVAINNMILEENVNHPVKLADTFPAHLPPFCFGMLAAIVNFALELIYNSLYPVQVEEEEVSVLISSDNPEPEKQLSEAVCSVFKRYRWNIVWLIVFLRILILNPGVYKNLFSESDEIPKWQMANLNSYWYAIFIFINDTHGGFWKFTHSRSKPQSSFSFFSKILYYFGLWSYPIYLLHPISYVTLAYYFPKTNVSLEVNILAILYCFALGGFVDLVIDKILVNKLILGKPFKFNKT